MRWLPALRSLLLGLGLLAGLASVAHAREGFYLGGGPTVETFGGDLDGKKIFVNKDHTRSYLIGKLDTGIGPEPILGYGFTRWIGIEGALGLTAHAVKHNAAPDSDAAALTLFFGARINAQVAPNLEVFARAGRSSVQVVYSDYALKGDASAGTSSGGSAMTLVGGAYALGVGAEWSLHQLALSAGYTYHDTSFDEITTGGSTKTLARSLHAGVQQVYASVVYYFPPRPDEPEAPDQSKPPEPSPPPAPVPGRNTALR